MNQTDQNLNENKLYVIVIFLTKQHSGEAEGSLELVTGFYPLSLQMKALRVTIQMKATEQHFPVVLFIMLYKVVYTFESLDEILKCDIQVKATEQYLPEVLFIMLYKVVLTFESVDEILKCDVQMKATEQFFPMVLSGAHYPERPTSILRL